MLLVPPTFQWYEIVKSEFGAIIWEILQCVDTEHNSLIHLMLEFANDKQLSEKVRRS